MHRLPVRQTDQVTPVLSCPPLIASIPTELTQYPPDTPPPTPYPSFKAVHHLPGHMRKPPNLYSSTVYASEPGAIVLHPAPRPSAPRRVDVPGVPGAFVVLDVFTPEECLQIVKAAEGVGFEKDEAAGGSAINKQSVSTAGQHDKRWVLMQLVGRFSQRTLSGWRTNPFSNTFTPRSYRSSRPLRRYRWMGTVVGMSEGSTRGLGCINIQRTKCIA